MARLNQYLVPKSFPSGANLPQAYTLGASLGVKEIRV